ncbi:MAG: hypothetical protein AAGF14_03815 [Pseudomonadota bacterium]
MSKELHDDLEGPSGLDSNYYGIWPGIAGVLIGLALIWFMFAVADGFA